MFLCFGHRNLQHKKSRAPTLVIHHRITHPSKSMGCLSPHPVVLRLSNSRFSDAAKLNTLTETSPKI